MSIEPIVFFDLVIALLIVAMALTLLAISYARTLQKFQHFQSQEEDIKESAQKKATEIIDDARNKALSLIVDANSLQEGSKQIVSEGIRMASLSYIAIFKKVADQMFRRYQKELESLKNINIKNIENISKDITNTSLAELGDFRQILKQETFDSQKIVEQKIEEEYQTTLKELQLYKQEKLKKLDNEIYNIIEKISTLAIRKSLSLEDHEELVIDALNKAKEEKILG